MHGLLPKSEVKMAGYWPEIALYKYIIIIIIIIIIVIVFACLWTETQSRSINYRNAG